MDRLVLREELSAFLKKYRWVGAVALTGLLLLMLPTDTGGTAAAATETAPARVEADTLQQSLETLLEKVEGAGKVRVLLSQASGEQIHYQTEEDRTKTDTSLSSRVETVIVTGSDRSQTGLVLRVDPPVYLGAVVLCQGADRPAVKLAIVDAVSTATGLSTDRIAVLKMK